MTKKKNIHQVFIRRNILFSFSINPRVLIDCVKSLSNWLFKYMIHDTKKSSLRTSTIFYDLYSKAEKAGCHRCILRKY